MIRLKWVAAFAVLTVAALAADAPTPTEPKHAQPSGDMQSAAIGVLVTIAAGIVREVMKKRKIRRHGDATVQTAEIQADLSREGNLWKRISQLESRVNELEKQSRVDVHELAQKTIECAGLRRTIADQEEQIRQLESELNGFRRASAAAGGK